MFEHILLAFDFAKRDFKERYVGTGLGKLWYVLSPVITIFIYTVIFSDFMKMRLNIIDSTYAYSIYLISGLLAWTSFSTILIRLTNAFFEKAHFIKKVNIPVYTYLLAILITEFILFCLAMVLGIFFLFMINHPVTLTFLWMLPVMVLQTLFAFSLGVILSVLTPFFKDLKEGVPVILQLWFWMTPLIYLKEMIADKYPFILKYNPFYYFAQTYQDIFLYSKAPQASTLVIMACLSLFGLFCAAYLYKKLVATIKDII